MTQHRTAPPTYAGSSSRPQQGARWDPSGTGWMGWVVFASVMMVLIGFFHALQGLVAIFDDEYYVVTDSGLTVALDYTVWGWTHLALGGVVVMAGLSLFSGYTWARAVAVGMAAISAVVNFGFIAAYPFWSLIVITMDVFVILALTVYGRTD
jgi:hypothetical protein